MRCAVALIGVLVCACSDRGGGGADDAGRTHGGPTATAPGHSDAAVASDDAGAADAGPADAGPGTTLDMVAPAVASYPPASGTCEVTYGNAQERLSTRLASWDADTRTLTADSMQWKLDEQGRFVEQRWEPDGDSGWALERDAHGTVTSVLSIGGQVYSTQVNTYGAQDELVRSVETNMSGQVITITYQYDGTGRLTGTLAQTLFMDRISETYSVREYEGARLRSITWGSVADDERDVLSVSTFYYDERGYLVRHDIAGAGLVAFHGDADIRQQWSYDDDGHVVRFEQDGTEIADAPFVDGVPDEVIEYEPACAQIAALPSRFYRLPTWLFGSLGLE